MRVRSSRVSLHVSLAMFAMELLRRDGDAKPLKRQVPSPPPTRNRLCNCGSLCKRHYVIVRRSRTRFFTMAAGLQEVQHAGNISGVGAESALVTLKIIPGVTPCAQCVPLTCFVTMIIPVRCFSCGKVRTSCSNAPFFVVFARLANSGCAGCWRSLGALPPTARRRGS